MSRCCEVCVSKMRRFKTNFPEFAPNGQTKIRKRKTFNLTLHFLSSFFSSNAFPPSASLIHFRLLRFSPDTVVSIASDSPCIVALSWYLSSIPSPSSSSFTQLFKTVSFRLNLLRLARFESVFFMASVFQTCFAFACSTFPLILGFI